MKQKNLSRQKKQTLVSIRAQEKEMSCISNQTTVLY